MNENDKTALVEEMAGILQGCVIIANMDEDAPSTEVSAGTINNIAYSILPIIEREVALAAVAPDDDAVERAAKALCEFDVESNGGYAWGDRGETWGSDYEYGRDHYRDMARTALAAGTAQEGARR